MLSKRFICFIESPAVFIRSLAMTVAGLGCVMPALSDNTGHATGSDAPKVWIVDVAADPGGDGSSGKPFVRINQAAELAQPGDEVLVRAGVYRERVSPKRGGTADQPITYRAADPGRVYIRGSDVFNPQWQPHPEFDGVWVGSLESLPKGTEAYHGVTDPAINGDFNPYTVAFNRNVVARPHSVAVASIEKQLQEAKSKRSDLEGDALSNLERHIVYLNGQLEPLIREKDQSFRRTLGQIFVNGRPQFQAKTREALAAQPGRWMVDAEGTAILLHHDSRLGLLEDCLVEATVRHTVFAPLERGLGHLHIEGFVIEHAANHFPTWAKRGWPQIGALSTRSGHHWVIRNNVIRHAYGLGVDCGSERDFQKNIEFQGEEGIFAMDHHPQYPEGVGYHLIEYNDISDNGHCGLAGNRHIGTVVRRNRVERNNNGGWSSPFWEFAGIKFHFFWDGLIEENLIRDNETHGIWLDHKWAGSRVTRNVMVNNLWSGVNIELGRGPLLIDNNIIALTRQGDGVYGHDLADITVAHNLLYANANYGAWFAFATPRVTPENGCREIKVFNNMVLGNRAGAIGLPMPWGYAGENESDGNLFMGGGQYLDEGSGPRAPLFQITNDTHMASMGRFLPEGITPQTSEQTVTDFRGRLEASAIPEDQWPNFEFWAQHYMVPLDQWQAVLGHDGRSATTYAIRDALNAQELSWAFQFDEALTGVDAQPIPADPKLPEIKRDYLGQPLSEASPLRPGPFQNVAPGAAYEASLDRPWGAAFTPIPPQH